MSEIKLILFEGSQTLRAKRILYSLLRAIQKCLDSFQKSVSYIFYFIIGEIKNNHTSFSGQMYVQLWNEGS